MTDEQAPERLRAGTRAGGCRGLWLTCLSPFALELAGSGAADWLGVDLQHGDLRVDDLPGLLRVATVPVLARSASHDRAELVRILDTGVAGVIVPAVESAAEAAALVQSVRIPPEGARGTGISRAGLLGIQRPLLLPMVETAAGLAAVEEIVVVPGLDGVFVGPYDLALSLGERDATAPRVLEGIAAVLRAADRAGVIGGLFAGNPVLLERFRGAGLLGVDSDIAALRIGLAALFDPR